MGRIKKSEHQAPFCEYPDVVSVSQLGQMLHISEKTAYKLIHEQKIGCIKIGRTYKIPKYNVLLYLSVENVKND